MGHRSRLISFNLPFIIDLIVIIAQHKFLEKVDLTEWIELKKVPLLLLFLAST